MTNKKTLKEVFEFFHDAQWVTEEHDLHISIWFTISKPYIYNSKGWASKSYSYEEPNPVQLFLNKSQLKIDWQHRKTWKERCVSRSEILGK